MLLFLVFILMMLIILDKLITSEWLHIGLISNRNIVLILHMTYLLFRLNLHRRLLLLSILDICQWNELLFRLCIHSLLLLSSHHICIYILSL